MLTVSSPPQACESTAVKLISALTKVSCLSASTIDDSEILSSVTESLAEVSAFPRNQLFRLLFIPLPNEFRKNSSSLCNSAAIGETLTRSIGNSLSYFYRYQNELLSYKRGKTNERAQQNLVRALRNLYNVTQNLVQIQGYRCYIQPILDTILIQSLRRGLLESQDDLVLILSLTDNLEPTCFSPVLLKFCQSLCRQIESSASVYNPAVPHSLLLAIFTNVIRLPQIRNYYLSLSIAQNKTCYRKLIQFLANPDLCVVIYAMRILALLVWDRPTEGKNNVPDGIGEKLFTSDNISQTVKLAFHLILCHSSSHIVQTAVDLLDVLLKREWIRNWVEGYQHLKTFLQSLTKKLRGILMSSDISMCHVVRDFSYHSFLFCVTHI
ncbi:hypothetical protein BKA69DRAFT_540304 [Paraphysoderma sedebokerense]|nr:hypothetical protein BKA69DRAFT_540304 [Paraphysoderma sedebokerense]